MNETIKKRLAALIELTNSLYDAVGSIMDDAALIQAELEEIYEEVPRHATPESTSL